MRLVPLLALCLLLPSGGAWAQAKASDTVTVYRCTDAAGRQSLRDSPCPRGQQQQARDMLRPKDAPKPAARPAPAAEPAPAVEAPVAYRAPPLPMFQCTTPDGERYTSETGDGNPRWVPYWTLGYPVHAGRPGRIDAGRGELHRPPPLTAGVSIPRSPPMQALPAPPTRAHRHPLPWPAASGGGQWIADACVLLPPGETCALLRDRRDAIRTRFFNAQEKERDALRIEERGINARLANDCGVR